MPLESITSCERMSTYFTISCRFVWYEPSCGSCGSCGSSLSGVHGGTTAAAAAVVVDHFGLVGLVEIDSIVPVVADAAAVVGVVFDLGLGIFENDSVQGDQGDHIRPDLTTSESDRI